MKVSFHRQLGEVVVDCDEYLALCEEGPYEPFSSKIKDDTHRTFASDKSFVATVSEDALIRVLNCYCRRHHRQNKQTGHYVQGMNLYAGLFLSVCEGNEADAFHFLSVFASVVVPSFGFAGGSIEGATRGSFLVNDILLRHFAKKEEKEKEITDEKMVLLLKGTSPQLWAFRCVLSCFCCSPPLAEVAKLWDAFLTDRFDLLLFAVAAAVIVKAKDILNIDNNNSNEFVRKAGLRLQRLFNEEVSAETILPVARLLREESDGDTIARARAVFQPLSLSK